MDYANTVFQSDSGQPPKRAAIPQWGEGSQVQKTADFAHFIPQFCMSIEAWTLGELWKMRIRPKPRWSGTGTGTGREKGNTAIGMAIARTIKQIAKYGYPDLAEHLKTSIENPYGRTLSYAPSEMTHWETDHSMLSSRQM